MHDQLAVIVAARNEADRIGETLAALRGAFPEAALWVADDASTDGTAEAAMTAGAQVVSRGRPHGKGANVGAAAEAALSSGPAPELVLLCDGDLGTSAAGLSPLVGAVERGECDLAVAAFSRRVGGGFGAALGVVVASRRTRRSPASERCAPRCCARCFPLPAATEWRWE